MSRFPRYACGDSCYAFHATPGLEVFVPDEFTTYELGVVNVTCDTDETVYEVTYSWTFAEDPEFLMEGPLLYMELVTTDQAGDYTCHAVTTEGDSGSASTEVIIWCKELNRFTL